MFMPDHCLKFCIFGSEACNASFVAVFVLFFFAIYITPTYPNWSQSR